MSVSFEALFLLLDRCLPCSLVVDEEGRIVHAGPALAEEGEEHSLPLAGKMLEEVLSPSELGSFRSAMAAAAEGGGESRSALWARSGEGAPLPLRSALLPTDGGALFLFWSDRPVDRGGLEAAAGWEMAERAKELGCLYAVADWIEASRTVQEFFEEFPRYVAQGMRYPEHAVVYSRYEGTSYGTRPSGKSVRAQLVEGGERRGEIEVGYDHAELSILPEEQTLLNEIARMLGLALDRKALSDSLAAKRSELENERSRLDTVNSYLDRIKGGLDESKVRLETMFMAIPDNVAIIDRNRNVIMTNRAEFAPGSKCHKIFFDSDKPCTDCRLSKIIREKAPIVLEIRHEDDYYEVHALPIFDKHHEVDGIIEFYRDVTYKKSYEQQLQQADKLASLGQLVSGIGHEINNPNQFIRGNIKILQQAMEDVLPILDEYYGSHSDLRIARLKYDFFREHILVLLGDVAKGSERIKRIVEDLKRFARRDEGLLIDTVDVNTVIHESARLVHNQVHKHADIELDLAPDLPTITGNAQKIEQVLINLMINAGQAIPSDRRGTIRVVTSSDDEMVTILVEDDGKGVSERIMNVIFDPFFTTKRATGGTGLGLSIAYRIIEEHRGTISVSSRQGEGTVFTIRIPHDRGKRKA